MSLVARVLVVAALVSGLISGAAFAAPPEIRISPELPSGWLKSGEYPIEATAESEAGITSLTAKVAGIRVKPSFFHCSTACPLIASATSVIKPWGLADGRHELVVTADDSTSQRSVARFGFRVDKTPPDAPAELRVTGGGTWRQENRFAVSWTNPAGEGIAPVVAAEYELCMVEQPSQCVSGRRVGLGFERIDDIGVPGNGAWRLRVVLMDEAGNVNRENPSVVDGLLLDTDPPALALAEPDPADPGRTEVLAADDASGLAQVTVEARRHGDDAWRPLVIGRSEGLAVVLDDDVLPEGTYRLRAHATDTVGNERTISTWPDGRPAEVRLPYRLATRLTVGRQVRTKSGTKLDRRPLIGTGDPVVLRGKAVDASGNGRGSVAITVSERISATGAVWRPIATITTDRTGAFAYNAPRGPARTIRFEHAATPTSLSASAAVELRVRGDTSIGADRRRLRNGQTITLRGRLKGPEVPEAGKLVTLQARTARGWVTFGTARARARDGRWSYRYTFTGTASTARYQFRVLVPREQAYPYVDGVSRRFSVLVRGG